MRTILVILAVLLVLGLLPVYPYSAHWGYYPSGGALLIAIVLIALVASGTRRGDIV